MLVDAQVVFLRLHNNHLRVLSWAEKGDDQTLWRDLGDPGQVVEEPFREAPQLALAFHFGDHVQDALMLAVAGDTQNFSFNLCLHLSLAHRDAACTVL